MTKMAIPTKKVKVGIKIFIYIYILFCFPIFSGDFAIFITQNFVKVNGKTKYLYLCSKATV